MRRRCRWRWQLSVGKAGGGRKVRSGQAGRDWKVRRRGRLRREQVLLRTVVVGRPVRRCEGGSGRVGRDRVGRDGVQRRRLTSGRRRALNRIGRLHKRSGRDWQREVRVIRRIRRGAGSSERLAGVRQPSFDGDGRRRSDRVVRRFAFAHVSGITTTSLGLCAGRVMSAEQVTVDERAIRGSAGPNGGGG